MIPRGNTDRAPTRVDALVLAVFTTFAASLLPAWKASRMIIVDAFEPRPMKFDLHQRLNFALRNVFRQRARSAGTLAAIALGVAGLILAAASSRTSFSSSAKRSFIRRAGISRWRGKATARGASARRSPSSSTAPMRSSARSAKRPACGAGAARIRGRHQQRQARSRDHRGGGRAVGRGNTGNVPALHRGSPIARRRYRRHRHGAGRREIAGIEAG